MKAADFSKLKVVNMPQPQIKADEVANAMRERFGKELLNQKEVAEFLGYNATSACFRNWLQMVPSFGEGRGRRFPVSGLAKMFTECLK